MQGSSGIFLPDEHLSSELSSFRAALNRVGNNITQIARRMNEAKKRGMPAPWSDRQYEEVRSLAGKGHKLNKMEIYTWEPLKTLTI